MERPTPTMLRIGDWCVNPASSQISRDGETARVEARTMRLLLCLADHAGEVVSIDDLLHQVWSGVFVSPDSVYQAVASLRRLLGGVTQTEKYVAVLPFHDRTDGMKAEEFADGMTEELIDKLSKIPGFRVPAPTSSFYFKGKQISVADVARTLGVAYVVDGSVRKSGTRLRVAARLIRAENGYIVWSETYDRPFGDKLWIQDDIAGEVTKALRASVEASPDH